MLFTEYKNLRKGSIIRKCGTRLTYVINEANATEFKAVPISLAVTLTPVFIDEQTFPYYDVMEVPNE